MNKLRYFIILIVILGVQGGLRAQDTCPWDKHLYEDEKTLMPELSEFLAGKRFILPEGQNLKGYAECKYDITLLKQVLQDEKFEIDKHLRNLKADEKAFFSWIAEFTRKRKHNQVNRLIPGDIEYELGINWRMRGAKSQRPNDKVQVQFKERKTDVFRREMSKILGIKVDAVILTPGSFTLEFFEVIKGIEYSDLSKINEFRSEMFFAFGEMLTITGLKHNAFRAYLESAELTENARQHEIAVIAAKEIQESLRADFEKFEDEFLKSQKKEARKFNAVFTLFAEEHTNYEDFKALKTAFVADYSSGNTSSILKLLGAGIFVLLMLIIISRKGSG